MNHLSSPSPYLSLTPPTQTPIHLLATQTNPTPSSNKKSNQTPRNSSFSPSLTNLYVYQSQNSPFAFACFSLMIAACASCVLLNSDPDCVFFFFAPAWSLRFFSRAFSRWLPRVMISFFFSFSRVRRIERERRKICAVGDGAGLGRVRRDKGKERSGG